VGTSQPTKKMFSQAFGVHEDSVFISGYPRNDMLLEAQKDKECLKKKITDLTTFKKVVIWMPTYRKNMRGKGREDGVEIGNPFYIKDFNITYFNEILRKSNTVCLVKPHPNAPMYKDFKSLSNVYFIDNKWISHQGVTLYQLLGCTDVLISDISSVIVDYMLLDQPIICVSTDFVEYKETRGFYFDDIEDWIPSRINTNQDDFFDHLNNVLRDAADPSRQKRERLKKYFFDDHDAGSTQRIVDHALNLKTEIQ
jgi:CDP-glycerol glycerophosphotransferase (TagB/SpsB family)